MENNKADEDRSDYLRFIEEFGTPDEDVQKIVLNDSDREFFLDDCFYKSDSKIHGIGIFSKKTITNGSFIARNKELKRTDLGRYVNHSKNPNCMFIYEDSCIKIIPIRTINPDEELTLDYRQAGRLNMSVTKEEKHIYKDEFIAALRIHVNGFENYITENEEMQVDTPCEHYFAPGIYTRKMLIPADTIIIGKIHKTRHLNMMVSGTARIMINGEIKEFDATNHPLIFMSEPGSKKVGYHMTDTVFITQHPILELTEEKIEALEADKEYAEKFVEDLENILTHNRAEELEMIKQEIVRLT